MLTLRELDLGGASPLSHDFPAGAITVVLGRNNSGKTRLARLVSGLETSAPGTVLIGDDDVSRVDARHRRVGLVFQAFVNYPNRTVAQNIASPLLARGAGAAEAQARVADLAARLRIGGLLHRLPHELSGGQQQRVAIARALAQDGRVLVMDEPLVNLDYKLREELQLELRALLVDPDLVVIYNTSDPKDAFSLGDEVLLLAANAKLQAGAPMDVYERPVELAAAHLMSDPGVNTWTEAGRVHAIRPEHLAVGAPGPGDAAFATTLTGLETNGADTFLHCRFRDADWVVRLAGMHAFEIDCPLALRAAERDVLVFG